MSNIRFDALKNAWAHKPQEIANVQRASVIFSQNVFTRDKMKEYIASNIVEELFDLMDNEKTLSRDIANSVAIGMKKWAMEQGATHYTHWFQPLTGGTAEKHDAFFDFSDNGTPLEKFSGSVLYQQEPDASSFPNGGIRNTFEARGYSAWDPSSPAFVIGDRLCIPTIFVAYTGEALDYKTPLLRSITAVGKAATAVANYFDKNVKRVYTYLGTEQEFFLVDEALYNARPDLMMTGRTLMGHYSSKNQQLDDHYLGIIPERVLAFMTELEQEALKLGIPIKTRHNEVAPNQFELAPIYEEANLGSDHNQLLMSLMEQVAHHHHFRVLFHEKPFGGVNGSGKHCNWSLGTNTGVNLLAPGKNPYQNLQFVTFLVNVLMAVHRHNGLLKASIASATNAHRLGGHEAPPAIISVFLGTQINEALDQIEHADVDKGIIINAKKEMKLGVGNIPEILLDNTDRNRTSPFAFTGNRFEFRAVGSSANCGGAVLALNAAIAEQLNAFREEVDTLIAHGEAKERALFTVIKRCLKECRAILFDGNGYSEEWQQEAIKRGLDTEMSVPLMIDQYLKDSTIQMFGDTGVLNRAELESRCEVKWENYSLKLQIESRVFGDLVINHVLPAAKRYQSLLLEKVAHVKQVFDSEEAKTLNEQDCLLIRRIEGHASAIIAGVDQMTSLRVTANHIEDQRQRALAFHDTIVPIMENIRKHVDELEMWIDDQLWTLPKYRELLFVH
jgi:glutamine synthetase